MKVVDINELKIKLDLADSDEDIRRILRDVAFDNVPYYVVEIPSRDKDVRLSLPQYYVQDPDFLDDRSSSYSNFDTHRRYRSFNSAIYTEDVLVLDNEGNVHQFDMHGKEHDVEITSLYVPSAYYPSKMDSLCIKHIIVPPSVRKISPYAFEGFDGLKSIQFHNEPHGVIIDEYAFKDCQSLKKLVLPKNVVFGSPNALCKSSVNELVFEDRTWDEIKEMLWPMNITHPGKTGTIMVTCCGSDEASSHKLLSTHARLEELDSVKKAV